MSDLSFSNQIANSQPPPDPSGRQARAALRAQEKTVRFHLLLNLGFAVAATWVLKIDGPYYADGISAGLFLCGCFLSLWSRRMVANGESRAGLTRSKGLSLLFIAFAVFFVVSAVAIVYYTYIVPPDIPFSDEESLTRTFYNALLCRRQFA